MVVVVAAVAVAAGVQEGALAEGRQREEANWDDGDGGNVKRKRDNCRARRSEREIKSDGGRAKNRETGTGKVAKEGQGEGETKERREGMRVRWCGSDGGGGSRRSNIQRNVPGG